MKVTGLIAVDKTETSFAILLDVSNNMAPDEVALKLIRNLKL